MMGTETPADDMPGGFPQELPNESGWMDVTPITLRENGSLGAGSLGGRPSASPALSAGRASDNESRKSGERNRSKARNPNRATGGQVRVCKKCGETLTGQFVRALDGTFHLDCFKCRDCGQIVASKFFPADDENGQGPYPLCETDYFQRLGLLCHECGGALRGSYITALERKYHVDHFTCSVCPTVFGAQDSYYEHDGQVYCHYHYSTQFAQRCSGCQTSILKQFVEIFRNGENQHWHPECYMIHKFWNVRLNPPQTEDKPTPDDREGRERIRAEEDKVEDNVYRIWSVLSTFEESSAACISDMLLHVSNGAYMEGVMVAKKFIWHVDILFQSADRLDATMARLDIAGLAYGREAKLLCKKIVAFFSLLSKTQDQNVRKVGVTQDLLTLVTGLAHYLKLLIRICLQGALRIEKDCQNSEGLSQFLDDLSDLDGLKGGDNSTKTLQLTSGLSKLSAQDSDQCTLCFKPVEDACAKNGEKRWHLACTNCSRCGKQLGNNVQDARLSLYDSKIFCKDCESYSSETAPPFERVTKLRQYIFLLQVALARLLDILQHSGITLMGAERPNTNGDVSRSGDERTRGRDGDRTHHRESSYESTLNDVRRLRSTRLDKHLSSSFRKARTSRIMDGPDASSAGAGAGATGAEGGGSNKGFQIVEERGPDDEGSDMMLPNQDALTLADIPRIVAAEQAREREQRPFPGRQELYRSPATEPRLGAANLAVGTAGHQRSFSDSRGLGTAPVEPVMPPRRGRKYFSELSGLDYFILRHAAVLILTQLLEPSAGFTLEELLGLIESRKAPTFWKNIGKAFKNDGRKNVKKKGVFGVPLEAIIERDPAESTDGVGPGTLLIPRLVDDIVSTMKQMDLSVEGVFRKNGNIKKLSELCEKIDQNENVDLGSNNVVQIAALLKRYLRELPDPLMTHKLYRLWLAAARMTDEEKKRYCLHLTCCLLPKSHRDCLEVLFFFLKWAGSFHQVDDEAGSRMDIKNLATVIAPNVLYNSSKNIGLDSDPIYAIEAVEILIAYIEEMCLVPDHLVDCLADPVFYNNGGDLTTKDILKRLGDRAMAGEIIGIGRHETLSRPPPRRVETDPSTWQTFEDSVRPVQEHLPTPVALPQMQTAANTPPSKWRQPADDHTGNLSSNTGSNHRSQSPSPYGPSQQQQQQKQQHENGQRRREWRNSGFGRPNGSLTTGTA